MKKKNLGLALLSTVLVGVGMLVGEQSVSAHGYVETPAARGYQGKLDLGILGWTTAFNKYGNVITNPQSLEAPKGFPRNGPADGRIASANGGFGQIGDYVLDDQTSNRWKKTEITTGQNTFTWKYTAPHKTSKWHYYMTKTNWNPNAPLTRDGLELIGTVNHDGSSATNNLSHTLTIPENRAGYHVILAVWDVADTSNAFYNVIDVNVNNSVIPSLPVKPTNVHANNVTKNSISLTWNAQTTAASYNVYRGGKKIQTVSSTSFTDSGLKADSKYSYQIEAVSTSGVVSEKSDVLTVKTLAEVAPEKPTTPSGLHSMGETETSISLMWNQSTHTSGIKEYQIYRNGALVKATVKTNYVDNALSENMEYNYVVKAISFTGDISDESNLLIVKTKEAEKSEPENPGDIREFTLGTFFNPTFYSVNEIVYYEGNYYETLVTHYNYGDSTWAPDQASSLFKKL
ncbi:MAG: lytic polysaccharide monooxygenase [Lactobacillales bacterium]|jgi:chitin-binding protein|nr:lytic polysaccharide monooxygenase [Lactobacillales bacterium]